MTTRTRQHRTDQPAGNLRHAKNTLNAALADLTARRATLTPTGALSWTPSRYSTLKQALYAHRGGAGNTTPHSSIPAWTDALALLIAIDATITTHKHQQPPNGWRPQDTPTIHALANTYTRHVKAIDALFAPRPIYLPDPCPHCSASHARRVCEDGETLTVPALAITADTGAICNACHDTWAPDELPFLAALLGRQTVTEGKI